MSAMSVKHTTRVPLGGRESEYKHVAQTGNSVFQWSQRVKINLEPAMTRTVASKIETVRTGNLRLP